MKNRTFLTITAAVVLMITGCGQTDWPEDHLGWGFWFASQMDNEKQRSDQQETVLMTMMELGERERAAEQMGEISNWRRASFAATLAQEYAKKGEKDRALEVLEQSRLWGVGIQGWQKERIRSLWAQAYSFLGDEEGAKDNRMEVTDIEEQFRASLGDPIRMVLGGDVELALEDLAKLEGSDNFVFNQPLVSTYVDISEMEELADYPGARIRFLEAAANLSSSMKHWSRIPLMFDLSEMLALEGQEETALALLDSGKEDLNPEQEVPRFAIPIYRDLLEAYLALEMDQEAGETMEHILQFHQNEEMHWWDRVMLTPTVAGSLHLLGRVEEANTLIQESLQSAEKEKGLKQRGMIMTELTTELAKAGVPLTPEMQDRYITLAKEMEKIAESER